MSTRVLQSTLIAAAVAILGCSSESATAPGTRDNAALILHFDSLENSTSGYQAIIDGDIVQDLALGAPVGAGTVLVNGAPMRMNVIAVNTLEVANGIPWDSAYAVIAWQRDGTDTAVAFVQTAALNTFATFGDASFHSVGGTVSIVPGALGAACTMFGAPNGVEVIQPIECHLQHSTYAFSASLGDRGPAVAMPRQTVADIYTKEGTPPPP